MFLFFKAMYRTLQLAKTISLTVACLVNYMFRDKTNSRHTTPTDVSVDPACWDICIPPLPRHFFCFSLLLLPSPLKCFYILSSRRENRFLRL